MSEYQAQIKYCPHYTHGPRACGGVSYQKIYNTLGEVVGVYRCTSCFEETQMSEHSVLLATQRQMDKLLTENGILHAECAALAKGNIELHRLLEAERHTTDMWRLACIKLYSAEELWAMDMFAQLKADRV